MMNDIKSYSEDDCIRTTFVHDIRLGNLLLVSVDTTASVLLSVCCD